MPRNNQRGRNNNNPEGRNQFSNGWMDTARDRPVAAAAVAAATVGAGVFLWSRRNQISEQLGHLSDQIGEWTENMGSTSRSSELETVGGGSEFSASAGTGSTGSQSFGGASPSRGTTSGMSETGGGNASLGKQSGGGGMAASSPKGRGRA